MAIPNNITKEHLLRAIEKIDNEGIPSDGASQYYDVIFNGKKYPPKLIVSYANFFANGGVLERSSFSGGAETESFRLLEKFNFHIEKKNKSNMTSYFEDLTKFLDQTETRNMKTSNYIKKYMGLTVKVGFGQGTPANIPWIAFLKDDQTVQEGIYPGYLYFKDIKLLVLAYCVSVTRDPIANWNLVNPQTIAEYFKKKNFGKPANYGSSFVFKVYDNSIGIDRAEIDSDLSEILHFYNEISLVPIISTNPSPIQNFNSFNFFDDALRSNFFLRRSITIRFLASLLTKPFVILTGLSGSGKTKLAQAFAKWICKDERQYSLIPVGADWTNREPLLGYPNALKPNEYVKPDSGALDLIIRATINPDLPYFLILDEMNLSHVERYFADFLSVMESKAEIPLFAEGTVENGVPSNLRLPPNLFIVGTVNIDETTNMFSPKVLDRANTIEFRITSEEMGEFLGSVHEININSLTAKGAGMAKSFLQMSDNKSIEKKDIKIINEELIRFFGQLKKTGAEFGYRTASEILRLIHQLGILDNTLTTNEKLDIAIMQKLLPKLHGSRRKLCPILITLGSFCIEGDIKMEKEVFEKDDFDFNNPKVLFPLALEKITRIYKSAVDNGFASYAEA